VAGLSQRAYAATKRDTDGALADVAGITRVIVRPPAILGAGETSIWNTLRPAELRDDVSARRVSPEQSFAWVHVNDLVTLIADVAAGRIPTATDPDQGPVENGCTAVNVAAGAASARDYYGTVMEALGLEPAWQDGPAWTGRIVADRARAWGWSPTVDLERALAEVAEGLRGLD
jgi:nucleoside-diphosphate-sugar epimerase